jgi:acyl-CoA reductase-like NAD-dependent aldehyde dehydrogenase
MEGFLRNHVGGKSIETGRVFENINPVDGSKVCDESEADSETVDRAVMAARVAVAGERGRLGAAERAALPPKVADRIATRFDGFLAAEIADTGHSLSHARWSTTPSGISVRAPAWSDGRSASRRNQCSSSAACLSQTTGCCSTTWMSATAMPSSQNGLSSRGRGGDRVHHRRGPY